MIKLWFNNNNTINYVIKMFLLFRNERKSIKYRVFKNNLEKQKL